MEYTYVAQDHLVVKDFGLLQSGNDLERGNCMWGGEGLEMGDWCGVKVQNPQSSLYVKRDKLGVQDGVLYGFAIKGTGPGSGGLRPEKQMDVLWICHNHDDAFHALHEDWHHTLMTFSVHGTVFALKPKTEQLFEVSFRFYTKADTDANHVSMRWTDVLNGVLEDTERVEYLKVVGT